MTKKQAIVWSVIVFLLFTFGFFLYGGIDFFKHTGPGLSFWFATSIIAGSSVYVIWDDDRHMKKKRKGVKTK